MSTANRRLLDIARANIESVKDDLQVLFDDLSEAAQSGPRGESLQEQIEKLEEIVAQLEDV